MRAPPSRSSSTPASPTRDGRPLADEFVRRYRVVGDVRRRIEPAEWEIEAPGAGTRDPLVVRFDRPLDHALLHRCLAVVDSDAARLPGRVAVADGERSWEFTPAEAWRDAPCALVVDTTLEDLAGNSVARVFDRELADPDHDPIAAKTVTLEFRRPDLTPTCVSCGCYSALVDAGSLIAAYVTPMEFTTIRVERADHVLTVTLDRPAQRNAFDWAMRGELTQLWGEVRDDADVRCVVVTGEGTAFCSGIDVGDLDDERRPAGEGIDDEIAFLPGRRIHVPVVAAVNGVCAGGGLHFVADADVVIASENAWFTDPHVSVGQVSGIEPASLALRVPLNALALLALAGRSRAVGRAAGARARSRHRGRAAGTPARTGAGGRVGDRQELARRGARHPRHHPPLRGVGRRPVDGRGMGSGAGALGASRLGRRPARVRRPPRRRLEPVVDFEFGATADALRAELRSLIAERDPGRLPRRVHRQPRRPRDRATVLRPARVGAAPHPHLAGRVRRARRRRCGTRPSCARRCGRTTSRAARSTWG